MKSNALKKSILSAAALLAALLTSAQAEPIICLTSSNQLLTFDSATPGTITKTVTITGLAAGENLVGIDFRPGTGRLYGLSSASRLYLINSETGAATAVGSSGAFTLNGTRFGVDFNPTVDRLRVTSDADQNLRLNPIDGTLTGTDMPLQYAAADTHVGANPNVVGSAYTNNFSTAGATILYGIDSGFDILVIQNPPNGGTLNTVGALGVDTTDNVGFDISGTTGIAYASLTVSTTTGLYTIKSTLRGSHFGGSDCRHRDARDRERARHRRGRSTFLQTSEHFHARTGGAGRKCFDWRIHYAHWSFLEIPPAGHGTEPLRFRDRRSARRSSPHVI